MKKVYFILFAFCFTIISCTRDSVDYEIDNREISTEPIDSFGGQVGSSTSALASFDCCAGTDIMYEKLPNNGPFPGRCCTYKITVTNNNSCRKVLEIDSIGTYGIDPYSSKILFVEICKETRVVIYDFAGSLDGELGYYDICYEDTLRCDCCSTVEVNVYPRPNKDNPDCCFYAVWLTNKGQCDVIMNDKFGNPIIIVGPGETDSSWQGTCNGVDKEFQLFSHNDNGDLFPCETIVLSGKCD